MVIIQKLQAISSNRNNNDNKPVVVIFRKFGNIPSEHTHTHTKSPNFKRGKEREEVNFMYKKIN